MNANFDFDSTAAASLPMPARVFPVRFLAICAAALCLATNLFAAPVQMVFDNVNGAEMFGVYVGPYSGTMDGAPVTLFCVDDSNEVQFGEQWDANLTPITSGSDLSDTRWGGEPDASALYQEAAWLSLQYTSQPVAEYGDIQATIWQLFSSTAPTPSSSYWLEQAQSNYASVNYGDFVVITNTGPVERTGQVQEFIAQLPSNERLEFSDPTQANVAPEPGTQGMIGLVLVGAGWLCRRRRTKQ